MRNAPGRVPSVPRRRRCSRGRRSVLGRRLPTLTASLSFLPATTTHPGELPYRGISEGSLAFTLPALPLTCGHWTEQRPSGFPLGFAPSRFQPRTPGWGPVLNTDRESRLRHYPNLQSTYSLTACDLVSQRTSAEADVSPSVGQGARPHTDHPFRCGPKCLPSQRACRPIRRIRRGRSVNSHASCRDGHLRTARIGRQWAGFDVRYQLSQAKRTPT
jgi:hypothetical protein